MKNKTLFVVLVFIILISFIAPRIILYLLEENNLTKIYIEKQNTFKTNYIYKNNNLINAVYKKFYVDKSYVEHVYMPCSIDDNKSSISSIENKILDHLKDLIHIKMIHQNFISLLEKENFSIRITEYGDEDIRFRYDKFKVYIIEDMTEKFFMDFEVEKSTGKIISLKILKSYINTSHSVLMDYIKYLQLENNDWEYGNSSIRSESLQIQIKIENMNDFVLLTLAPIY